MQPVKEFFCFVWLALYDIPQLSTVKLSLKFLINKGVSIYGLKCFDKFINLNKFLEGRNDNEDFFNLLAHLKWEKYFENCTNVVAAQNFLILLSSFS
jgi:hypothetical protein